MADTPPSVNVTSDVTNEEPPLVDIFSAMDGDKSGPSVLPPDNGSTPTFPGQPPVAPTQQQTPAQPTTPKPAEPDPIAAALEKGKQGRDYSDLDEEEKEIFQKMSNNSYNKLYPIYKAYKANGGKFDDTKLQELQKELEEHRNFKYFEHPDAFTASPEYQETARLESVISDVHNHWVRQLTLAESGQKIRPLVRGQNGYEPGNEIEATPAVKAEIFRLITKTQQDLSNVQQDKARLLDQFKSRYSTYETNLNAIHKKLFSQHEATLKPLAEKELQMFPAYVRHQPAIRMLAYAIATLKLGASAQQEKKITDAGQAAAVQLQNAAGPSNSQLGTGSGKAKQIGPLSDEEYKKMRSEFSY